jgi:hypothetical protein
MPAVKLSLVAAVERDEAPIKPTDAFNEKTGLGVAH